MIFMLLLLVDLSIAEVGNLVSYEVKRVSGSTYLLTLQDGMRFDWNIVLHSRKSETVSAPTEVDKTLYCNDFIGMGFFAIRSNSLTVSTGLIHDVDGIVRSFQCDNFTCLVRRSSDNFNPKRASVIMKTAQQTMKKNKRTKRQIYDFHRALLSSYSDTLVFRIGIQVAVDYDALRYFCETNNINHHSGRDAVRRDCCGSSATAGLYPQACQQLYDYYSIYISFVAQIFDNADGRNLKFEFYLAEVVIAFTRNGSNVTSLLGPTLDGNGTVNYISVFNQALKNWRNKRKVSTVTVLMTHYRDHNPNLDALANTESVCTDDSLVLVWDVFRYFTVRIFAHEIAHVLGILHRDRTSDYQDADRENLMTEFSEWPEPTFLSCMTQTTLMRFLGFGITELNMQLGEGKKRPLKLTHCVHLNEPAEYEKRVSNYRALPPSAASITPEELCGASPEKHRAEVCETSTKTLNCQTLSCAGLNSSSPCIVIFNSSAASGLPPDGMSCSQSGDFCYKGQCIKPEIAPESPPKRCSYMSRRRQYLSYYKVLSKIPILFGEKSQAVNSQQVGRYAAAYGSGVILVVGFAIIIIVRIRQREIDSRAYPENND